jgi:hypothetical protein
MYKICNELGIVLNTMKARITARDEHHPQGKDMGALKAATYVLH